MCRVRISKVIISELENRSTHTEAERYEKMENIKV